MKNVRFNDHKAAACYKRLNANGNVRALVSYATTVIEIDEEGWLIVHGLYSMTTIKHIGWFMRELGYSYMTAKHLYNKGLQMNIYTGEVKAI